MTENPTIKSIANTIAEERDTDILFVSGEIGRPHELKFVKSCSARNKRKNVILVLVTPGGDAHVAFKMARCLLENYEKYSIYVPYWCKSAGTLLAIGAHELVMSDVGELGPIDVQMGKADEIGEYSSGLDLEAALESLGKTAFEMFMNFMISMKGNIGQVTLKTACDVSSRMMTDLLSPIYSRIDPLKIGDISRSINVARSYGRRLNMHGTNLKTPKSLEYLVSGYPDHGFVIDYIEACTLFKNVSRPDEALKALTEILGDKAIIPLEKGLSIDYLNDERREHAANESEPTPATPIQEQSQLASGTRQRNRKNSG